MWTFWAYKYQMHILSMLFIVYVVVAMLAIYFVVRRAILFSKLSKITYSFGTEVIIEENVVELFDFVDRGPIPFRFYSRDMIKGAFKIIEEDESISKDLKKNLRRKILSRGILV